MTLDDKKLDEILHNALGEATDDWEQSYPGDWEERLKTALNRHYGELLMEIIEEEIKPIDWARESAPRIREHKAKLTASIKQRLGL